MEQIPKFTIRCAFCGETNDFTKEELYQIENGNEIFKEKYCLECNEPLTMKCPSCAHSFNVEANFSKNHFFKELDSFWNPVHSPLDQMIPLLSRHWSEYETQAKTLSVETFRLSQKQFLESIPSLLLKLHKLDQSISQITQLSEISKLEKSFKKVLKEIQRNMVECDSILASIEDSTKAVTEKKEKQLKKHIPFLDMHLIFQDFIDQVKILRQNEISKEIESLKPGFNKIKKNIKQDPTFYRNICPICQKMIFTINHQVYTMGIADEKLVYVKNLTEYYLKNQEEDSLSRTLKLSVKIHIEKDQIYDFQGDIVLVLHEDEKETIGRDGIREIEYEEEASEDILFDENDPLARISNKQFSMIKKGTQIILLGMAYDERRIGTFLNSLEYDIRIEHPDGIPIKSGDHIIIPLINEKNNPNYIDITVQ